jgi:gliding motility-associated-like protein
VIKPIPDTCVVAGNNINFIVEASDPDGHSVALSGAGGPMMVAVSPATFPSVTHPGTVSSVFNWNTVCDHVQKSAYTMYFKAQDNGFPVNLVDIKYVNLTVIAPRVENLQASPLGNSIVLQWDISPCPNAVGYRVYRRSGFYGYVPDYCETGVPSYTGYQQIGQVTSLNTLTFTDDDQGSGLIHGVDYCYMVIAYFDDGAESIASEEVCVSLKRDLPIITNISIRHTDVTQGSALVAWVKPTELDFTQTPGPFKYLIYRATPPGTSWVLVDSLSDLADTSYVDSLLNTRDVSISYEIALINDTPGNRFLVGYTHPATSVFLNLLPSDRQITLKWSYSVPWTNDTTVIYRKDLFSGLFDSIGFSTSSGFADTNLVNGTEYCYYVMTSGQYSDSEIPAPLLNLSQRTCASPVDNVPPCAPTLSVDVNCESSTNTLSWTNPNLSCADDTYKYYVYFKAEQNGDHVLLDSVFGAGNTVFYHTQPNSVVGCYVVTAFDTLGNQSVFSNEICISSDSCPTYALPNVFTPNADNHNDLFKPFPYNSVAKIMLTIYNRWGSIVFTTEDPDINWDGKDKNSDQPCSDGVYFYVCDVYEITLSGQRKRSLSGIVTLIRN